MNRAEKVIENLAKNNMCGYYVENKTDVVPLVTKLISEGDTVAVGGSVSLFECGVIELLRNGKYNFLDRYKPGLTPLQIQEIFLESFSADVYLSSSNAVTDDGELYNVDGNSNRVASICYGPKSVILVVGWNKIVKDIDEAIIRVKKIAAPKNSIRLSAKTFCSTTGRCVSDNIAKGCSHDRICCNYVVSSYQSQKNRIKVILVGENLGY